MDEEHTSGFREACGQCSAVDWGVSDEGRFYCRSCHNVIERTKEVVDPTVFHGSNRISTVVRGARLQAAEPGLVWTQCEGFQWILRNQADALLRLGVHAHFKDAVLCPLWRRYLQTSQQAYTWTAGTRSAGTRTASRARDEDSDVDSESLVSGPISESCSDWSESGDASSQLTPRERRGRGRGRGLMTMRKTLALIHLALVWSREALTLSDLLRLVRGGHVPYINAYQQFPEEMKLINKDALVFRVESVPSHRAVHRDAQSLAVSMQLPAFPPISRRSLIHPELLSLRYLTEANLPDQLHPWFCLLLDRTGLADEAFLTFDPGSRPVLPQYEVQTAAVVVVTMKLLFGLDDQSEWNLSNEAGSHDDSALNRSGPEPGPDPTGLLWSHRSHVQPEEVVPAAAGRSGWSSAEDAPGRRQETVDGPETHRPPEGGQVLDHEEEKDRGPGPDLF
ncbi:TATA box-binding protein-associated factor RNA polymerase I subunit B isoform X2 [Mugil cephalus]|uniref:TATA box-binding protein-associated factor RNA polymerase I subunit B isoform X2 n=1 Tax=Mugil cephalus TaxID=48193 RepID=UPI001FB5F4FD|nr:TATA box-binding protein-associated factor RNA polymerase I subunit B isoform X2 [Mugil cephalus]